MTQKLKSIPNWFWVIFIPFVIRLPLLFLGYGVEEDAWGHVLNGLEMNLQGQYIISRLPGHPALELLSFFNWWAFGNTYFLWNLAPAIAASWAAFEFYRILLKFQIGPATELSLAFSVVPIVLFSGASFMDYAFQLALILAAYRRFLDEKFIFSGVLIGLAMGFRLTSALILLPILWELFSQKKLLWKNLSSLLLPFLTLSILSYIPAYNQLGWEFFNTYSLPYPSIAKAIYKGSLGAFGLIGFLSILFFGFKTKFKKNGNSPIFWFWMIGLHLLLFIRIPEKSAFLIPAVPFLILAISHGLSRFNQQLFALLLILNSFVMGIHFIDPIRGSDKSALSLNTNIVGQNIAFDFLFGEYAGEWTKRINKLNYVDELLKCKSDSLLNSTVIAGWWYAMLMIEEQEMENAKDVDWHYYIPGADLKAAEAKGLRIFALPEQEAINSRKYAYPAESVKISDYPCP